MRTELVPFIDQKVEVRGRLKRYGLKPEYAGGDSITLLLQPVYLIQEHKTIDFNHAWLTCGKTLAKCNIPTGSLIQFTCHVKLYKRGPVPSCSLNQNKIDIGIKRASHIQIIKKGEGETFAQFYRRIKEGRFITNKYDGIVRDPYVFFQPGVPNDCPSIFMEFI